MKISFTANNLVERDWVLNHGFKITKEYEDSSGTVIRRLRYIYNPEAKLDNLAKGAYVVVEMYNKQGEVFRTRTISSKAKGRDLLRLNIGIRTRQIETLLLCNKVQGYTSNEILSKVSTSVEVYRIYGDLKPLLSQLKAQGRAINTTVRYCGRVVNFYDAVVTELSDLHTGTGYV